MSFLDSATLFMECVLIAGLSGVVWFAVIVVIDPHRREKGSGGSIFISFALGFASIPLVFLLYSLAPDVAGGAPSQEAWDGVNNLLVVGPVEEFSKFFIFFLIMTRRKPMHEPLDSMLHAAAVALAFSLTENVKYGLYYGPGVVVLRAFLSTPGHLCYAAIWGFAYAALIHANPRRRLRDFIVLFFSIYPAAVLHGLSNIMLTIEGDWWLLFDGAQFVAAFGLILWLQSKSPLRGFRLMDASTALQRIQLSLSSNGNSFSLNLRAALARTALGEYAPARAHIEKCLDSQAEHPFVLALLGVIQVLQGDTAGGERILAGSFPSLSPPQKRNLGKLARHVARARKTENAYNEFQLSMWFRSRRGD